MRDSARTRMSRVRAGMPCAGNIGDIHKAVARRMDSSPADGSLLIQLSTIVIARPGDVHMLSIALPQTTPGMPDQRRVVNWANLLNIQGPKATKTIAATISFGMNASEAS